MSILNVDDIQPVGSGTSVTINSAATLFTNNIYSSGVVTATTFSGDGSALTNVGTGELISNGNTKAQVVDTGSDGHFKIETEGTERIRIISNGYVGIGTTAPTELFDIQSDDSAELRLYTKASTSNATLNLRAGNSGNSKIEFGDTADDDIGVLKYVHSNNTLQYSYYSNERIRIGSQGQIGIEGENYGETGQVLKSRGISDSPEWAGYPRRIGLSTASGQAAFSYITIPSYATKITVAISRLSLSGTNNAELQLGTSAGYITSGYYSCIANMGGTVNTLTDCFSFFTTGASHAYSGAMTIYKINDSEYCFTYTSTNGAGNTRQGGGHLTGISGTIDRLQITTDGSDTFDNGTITIYAE
jgi:hypothetical protein